MGRKSSAATLRRKQRDKGSGGKLKQLNRVYRNYDQTCYWCGTYVKRSDASREHLVPLSEGGSREDENVRLSHSFCNR